MKTYKEETTSNLTVFINSFGNKPKDSTYVPFILKTSNIYIDDLNYVLIDENKKRKILFSAKNTGGNIEDFKIEGSNIYAKIRGLYFIDDRNIEITNLTTNFFYSEKNMLFKNTTLQTPFSNLKATVNFNYTKEEFKDFNNKVKVQANFIKSSISIVDLKKLYNEFNGDDIFFFTGKMSGTLNSFNISNFNTNTKQGLKIKGNLQFTNAIETQKGFVFKGNLKNITTHYNYLKNILPNLLGKNIPTEFKKLGTFNISGLTKVTSKNINATLTLKSKIGIIHSDLELLNIYNLNKVSYSGNIELIDFNLGKFSNIPSLEKITLQGDISGDGFRLDNLNTSIIGKVSKLEFNKYTYKNITINGQVKNRLFDGELQINDELFKMNFIGLADLSSTTNRFNFTANITHANLKKTHLFTRDSVAIFKGNISLNTIGNSFDNMIGKASFKNISYKNQKKEYFFKEFLILSTIKDGVKKITIDSEDIVKGQLVGNFSFKDLTPLTLNALGSIYTNYSPYKIAKHQSIKFNFKIFNQIVDVFFPQLFIDKNTRIKGKINGNNNLLRVTIQSPKIIAYGNEIKDLYLRTDSKNKLYNTHILASEITTKYYKFSKVNLLNRTERDTLFFKSIFKGGKKKNENFNLDFFFTIDKNKNSIIGLQKSKLEYKENIWSINPKKDKENKITFNLKTNEFIISPFLLKSNEQKIIFKGVLKDSIYKNLEANFKQVKLESILPKIDSLSLKGVLNGTAKFIQKNNNFTPEGSLLINNFKINNQKQGHLALFLKGENSYQKYSINLSLDKKNVKNINANGFIDFATKKPQINLNVFIEDYDLKAFSPLGKDVISNIRGKVNGNFTLQGNLSNPLMNGNLTLQNGGLKFPYLNINYNFKKNANILLKEQSFVINNFLLEDTKYKSKGVLKGNVTHQNFSSWFFDIKVTADNLLVLDTKETEESLYYGTAFLKGEADITGLTDNLTIDVNGKTAPKTVFVIPLKDIETIDNYKLIHFKTKKKRDINKEKELAIEEIQGLNLNIHLDVTNDAIAQVVIDEVYGSQLKGKGIGTLDIEIDTRGKFNMFGDYTIDEGIYDFKYGGIINKPFKIVKGGTISWNGSPYDANLNIKAIYETKANPAVLLKNFNTSRNIPIDLEIKITGGLFNSKQDLDIKLPNVDPTIASELEFILNDNNINEKTTQFVSLLALGSFVNSDRINIDNTALTGAATSAIASAFSRILNSNNSKFELGFDYKQGVNETDVERLNIDSQVDFSLKTKISDRVVINGKVGVPVGTKTQSSVVGEVIVEVLLNKEGNLRMVIFNRQNEIQYSTEEEGYTQGMGLSYQVNFNSLSDLLRKITKRKKKLKQSIKKDSILSTRKKLINFKQN